MGKLRIEPKFKPPVDVDEYKEIFQVLREALKSADDQAVYWDLDEDEDAAQVKKQFQYVAEKEGIPVTIRRLKNQRTFSLVFAQSQPEQEGERISAEDARKRILTALVTAGKPIGKSDILKHTSISRGTWNLRIRELVEEGIVKKQGNRGDTVYSLV